jgi:hypothetical protein
VPVYPPILDPYSSLTPAELATFGVGPSYAPVGNDDDNDDDDDEVNNDDDEEVNDDEETNDDE